MERLTQLRDLLAADRERMQVLALVRELALPDCWVGAGFVRNAVWDHLHGRTAALCGSDIDVIWYDAKAADPARDAALDTALRCAAASLSWSVKNQARMHERNGDRPYASALDAMRYWPETATAVAIRLDRHGAIEVAAPYGLDDLFGLVVRPTERFKGDKLAEVRARMHVKGWLARWPRLVLDFDF